MNRCVRKGCVLSSDLLSLYHGIIMRNLEGYPGIKVEGNNLNNLRCAADMLLLAKNKEDLPRIVKIVVGESRKNWLEWNSKNTEVLVVCSVNTMNVHRSTSLSTEIKLSKGVDENIMYLSTWCAEQY